MSQTKNSMEKPLGTQIEIWLYELSQLIFKFPYTFFALIFRPSSIVDTFHAPQTDVQPILRPYSFLVVNMFLISLVMMRLWDVGGNFIGDTFLWVIQQSIFPKGQFNLVETIIIIIPSVVLLIGSSALIETTFRLFEINVPKKYVLYYLTLMPYAVILTGIFFIYAINNFISLSLIASCVLLLFIQFIWVRPLWLLNQNCTLFKRILGTIGIGAIFVCLFWVNTLLLTSWYDKWRQTIILTEPNLHFFSDGRIRFDIDIQSKLHNKTTIENENVFVEINPDTELLKSLLISKDNQIYGFHKPDIAWNDKQVNKFSLYPGAEGSLYLSIQYKCELLKRILNNIELYADVRALVTIELPTGHYYRIKQNGKWQRSTLQSAIDKTCDE